jgi:hypothetical protein
MALTDDAREGIRAKAAQMAAAAPRFSEEAVTRLRSLLKPRQVEAPDDQEARRSREGDS